MQNAGRTTEKVLGALRFAKEFHEILRFDLRIATLHPGGGTYDCFAICDSQQSLAQFNYVGNSGVTLNFHIDDAWDQISASPRATAEEFARQLTLSGYQGREDEHATRTQIEIYENFIQRIEADPTESWNLIWGYFDSTYGVEPNLPSGLLLPASWKELEALSAHLYSWEANVLLLTRNEEIVAIANQANGEILS